MKKLWIGSLLGSILMMMVGCGNQTPFKRGPHAPAEGVITPAGELPGPKPPPDGTGQGQSTDKDHQEPISPPFDGLKLDEAFFDEKIAAVETLGGECIGCHNSAPMDFRQFEDFSHFAIPGDLEGSKVLQAAQGILVRGDGARHRKFLDPESEELKTLVAWIMGATLENPNPVVERNSLLGHRMGLQARDLVPQDLMAVPDRVFFEQVLGPQFARDCNGCHDNPISTYNRGLASIVVLAPEKSPIYLRCSGADGHYEIWGPGSEELDNLKRWINLEP